MADDAVVPNEAGNLVEQAAPAVVQEAAPAPVAETAPVAVEPVAAVPAAVETVAAQVAAPKKVAGPKARAAKAAKQAKEIAVKAPAAPAPVAALTPAVVKKSATKRVVAAKKPVAIAKPVAAKSVITPKQVKAASQTVVTKIKPVSQIKENIMTKTTETITTKIKDVLTEAQAKAKVAMDKGSATFSEAGSFAKGNVEALVESGKLLSTGVQELGKGYVAESKTAFETITADVKELAAVKSPTDFFKLQGEIARRNFDSAVAQGTKNGEAVLKLFNTAFAPISTRVNLAVSKVSNKAA